MILLLFYYDLHRNPILTATYVPNGATHIPHYLRAALLVSSTQTPGVIYVILNACELDFVAGGRRTISIT